MKTFVYLKATEVEDIFFVFEKSIVDGGVPVASLDIKRRANQSRITREHFLSRTAGSMDVSREFVLQRFEAFGQGRVEILFDTGVKARLRGCSHDVRRAQERNREQAARRVVRILNQIERLAAMELFEFADKSGR